MAGGLTNNRLAHLTPPQALEDRGIVELLLTSDNKDGLSKGIVDGGIPAWRLCAGMGTGDGMAAWPGCAPWIALATNESLMPVILCAWGWAPKLKASGLEGLR